MTYSVIVASNNDDILSSNLMASPDLATADFSIQRNAISAAEAYNRGIDSTTTELMVFVHQDMFLPPGWLSKLQLTINILQHEDSDWGVLGMFGCTKEGVGEGYIYSTGLRRTLGSDFDGVREVQSLDEILLVIRRSSRLRFDESIPGFHLYGADICVQAQTRGLKVYAFSAFGIHNTNGIPFLPKAYWKAYLRLRRKWWSQLPVMTPCMPITKWLLPAFRYFLRRGFLVTRAKITVGRRVANPATLLENKA